MAGFEPAFQDPKSCVFVRYTTPLYGVARNRTLTTTSQTWNSAIKLQPPLRNIIHAGWVVDSLIMLLPLLLKRVIVQILVFYNQRNIHQT